MAPLPAPLSTMSSDAGRLITVPRRRERLVEHELCSPATTLTQSMPVSSSFAQKPG